MKDRTFLTGVEAGRLKRSKMLQQGSQFYHSKNNSGQKTWQGLETGNITFSDELDFDPSELDHIYAEPDEGAK